VKKLTLLACLSCFVVQLRAAEPYSDRFVWIFGWGLGEDGDVAEVTRVLEAAGQHGFNGAVLSSGLDTLCKQSPDYFRRLDQIKQACERNRLELIPAVFSVGYGGGILAHDRNLAEGLPVEDAPFLVKGSEARLVQSGSVRIVNGGFEQFTGNKLSGFAAFGDLHCQPLRPWPRHAGGAGAAAPLLPRHDLGEDPRLAARERLPAARPGGQTRTGAARVQPGAYRGLA
jgi:hypothetical protein